MPLSALSPSPNLVPMILAPLASCCPRTRTGDRQSHSKLVHLRYLLELKPKLILLACFLVLELQLLALLFPVVQERWWVVNQIGKSLNFLIFNLEAPFGASILKLVVGSVKVVGCSSFCLKEKRGFVGNH